MSERWVLILAYHFPPENAIGGLRPYRFSKYLPEHGYKCHVITAADVITRPDLPAEYVADPFFASGKRRWGWQLERLVRKLLLPGSIGTQWSSLAYRAASRFLSEHSDDEVTVLSTWPPLGPHLAAWRLAKRFRLSWIADFRDPLADNPTHRSLGRHSNGLYSWLERRFLNSADAFIANTDEAERVLKAKYPGQTSKIHLIWNGFDPEDAIKPTPLPTRSFHLSSHVGELYEGRTIAPVIESVARLIALGRLAPHALHVQLVGPAAASCLPDTALMDAAIASGWLSIVPHQVPKQQALEIAQASDSLQVIQPHSSIQVPGKLFEYLQMGRPILAFVPRESAIERVLSKSGATYRAIYTDWTREAFDEAMLDFFTTKALPVQTNDWFQQNFDARLQTSKLARIIGDCHPPTSP